MKSNYLSAAAAACFAVAGAIAADPPAANPLDAAHLAEARAVIGAMQLDKQLGAVGGAAAQGMAPMLSQLNPRRDPRVARIAMEEAVAQMREDATRPGGMIDQLTQFYASEFTIEELKQLRAFHDSPVGQHMRQASPKLAQQMMQRSQAGSRDMLGRVCARVKTRLASENIPDDVRCPAPDQGAPQPGAPQYQYAPQPGAPTNAPPPGPGAPSYAPQPNPR